MTISNWALGVLLTIVTAIKLFWAADLIGSALSIPMWRRLRSGSLWLGIYNLGFCALFSWFIWIAFRDPHRQQPVPVAIIIIVMAVGAALAWHFLREEAKELAR